MAKVDEAFSHPYDTAPSAGLRFAMELIAWSAGPWAAAAISIWLVAPVLAILIALPAIFSTAGDKRKIVVPTPGFLRVAIEVLLLIVAIAAPWTVWPIWLAIPTTLVALMAFVLGFRRTRWLLIGAPPTLDEPRL